MCGALLFFAIAATGVDHGWQPLPYGGVEYLIQIEPELIDTVKRDGIASDIPPHLKDVRSYRITIGREKLPRTGSTKKPLTTKEPPKPKKSPSPQPSKSTEKMPARLRPSPESKPLGEKSVAFLEKIAGPKKKPSVQPPPLKPTKPWLALWIVIACLGCSVGANLYLGWITWDTRSRYRTLLTKWLSRMNAGLPQPEDQQPDDSQ